ncbi:hypothetical protein RD055328_10850 [Companilactobacillus sp. RD055328]|uniref:glycoside hydrolase family 73 protein n=1 Tax=Companilactobacillus sp. RD055328 TaxID=2916634 RepID=UPI001FC845C2|nr:glycoside hydrolase family 73 protein [Companilactobacillus sp. RD055328]GKQ43162.1 hypothetical protein RD055328_10850 [Companilactobacillus sp. RD055328]
MKNKLKNSLMLTGILSASLLNTQSVLLATKANTVMADKKDNNTNADENIVEKTDDVTNQGNNKDTNVNETTGDISGDEISNIDDTKTDEKADSDQKVSTDSSMGPGFYDAKIQTLMARTASIIPRANTSAFINSVSSGAVEGWKKYKVLPSVTIAQAIVESAWGQSGLAVKAHNLFGIKGRYNGQYVVMPTQEYINGEWITINAEFRKYPSNNESIDDHGNFLVSNPRYSNLLGVTDYKTVTKLLHQDGYATAPNYPEILNSIIETYGLTKYDDVAINASNGSLDSSIFTGDTIKFSGWHTAQASTNKPYSFIILIDNSTGREVQRVKINRTQRKDVYNAYPDIPNSEYSGFEATFKLTDDMYGKNYSVISRYSSDPKGDNDTSDYTYSKSTFSVPTNGSLDSNSTSQTEIKARGWHVSNSASKKPYSYLFLLDANTHQEVKRIKINRTQRSDVQKAFYGIDGSINSGFETSFEMDKSMYGKKYIIMSRYSSDPNGNVGNIDYTFDNIISTPQAETKASSMDNFTVTNKKIHLDGWQIDNNSQGKKYSFAIMLDQKTGKEVKRFKINRTKRPDVQKAYPGIYNSGNGGFSLDVPVDNSMRGHSYKFLLRYTSDPNGDWNTTDVIFDNIANVPDWEQGNYGDLFTSTVTGKDIYVYGWHASSESYKKPYSYLFLLDAETKTEVKRYKIERKNRDDVANAYPNIINADKSGFETNLKLDKNMYGKKYVLMSRYTDDVNGNGNSTDYIYGKTLTTPDLATKASSLDSLTVTNKNIHIQGWQADNRSKNKPYSYIIMLDTATGREYKRFKINRIERKDVEDAYPFIYNSKNSGFSLNIPITKDMKGHNYKYLIRYSSGVTGNGDNADVVFDQSTTI